MFTITKPEHNKTEIKPGKYQGNIAKCEVGATKAGHKTLKLRLKLEGFPGFHFVDLNMEHEKTKAISQQILGSILYGALVQPPTSLATLQDIADFITGLPVNVMIKERLVNGEVKHNTYFNDCPAKMASKTPVASSNAAATKW
jgi:hypothetical protein